MKLTEKRAAKCRDCEGTGYLTINRTGKRAIRCLTCHGTSVAGKLRTVKHKAPAGRAALASTAKGMNT